MTIDKLSKNSLKICLDRNDFKKYHITHHDIDINNIKMFLFEISDQISEILEINSLDSKLFVEVFSYKNSCIIFLSNISDESYYKAISENIICQFDRFERLESFCRTLNALYKNSVNISKLYCGRNNIRLILKLNSDFENISRFAEESCKVLPLNEINSGATDEYYNLIIAENAVRKILENNI